MGRYRIRGESHANPPEIVLLIPLIVKPLVKGADKEVDKEHNPLLFFD